MTLSYYSNQVGVRSVITISSSSGSSVVRVFIWEFKFCSMSESGVIFFFDPHQDVKRAQQRDRSEAHRGLSPHDRWFSSNNRALRKFIRFPPCHNCQATMAPYRLWSFSVSVLKISTFALRLSHRTVPLSCVPSLASWQKSYNLKLPTINRLLLKTRISCGTNFSSGANDITLASGSPMRLASLSMPDGCLAYTYSLCKTPGEKPEERRLVAALRHVSSYVTKPSTIDR